MAQPHHHENPSQRFLQDYGCMYMRTSCTHSVVYNHSLIKCADCERKLLHMSLDTSRYRSMRPNQLPYLCVIPSPTKDKWVVVTILLHFKL
jgi:hypothetical protein